MDDDLGFTRVAGVSFYQSALERCAAGQAVSLVHEPDNPHDPMAIRVVSILGETIGYVPRRSWIHHEIHERGRGIAAVIASIGYSRACLLGATISASVTDDRPAIRSYHAGAPVPESPAGGFRYWVRGPNGGARRAA